MASIFRTFQYVSHFVVILRHPVCLNVTSSDICVAISIRYTNVQFLL